MTHTQTPWEVRDNKNESFTILGLNEDVGKQHVSCSGKHLTVAFNLDSVEDAEFIVTACNAHEQLLEASEIALSLLTALMSQFLYMASDPNLQMTAETLRSAILAAKGEMK